MRHRTLISLVWLAACLLAAVPAWGRVSADVSAALNFSGLHPGQTAMIAVVVTVHDGLHAQSHTPLDANLIPFQLKPDANTSADFLDAVYPPGEVHDYEAGKMSVYTGKVIAYLPIRVKPEAATGAITLSGVVNLQACTEKSCYAPENEKWTIQTTIVPADQATTSANAELFAGAPAFPASTNVASAAVSTQPATPAVAPPSMPAATVASGQTTVSLFGFSFDLHDHSPLLAVAVAFLAGIIFNVVPCVLPVLPVKAIGFYEASQHSRARSLLLGFVFSLGLVALFAALGMVVILSKSLFGHQITWGQQFSYPWFVWGVALVLGVLGFGMLGAFSMQLPTSVYGLDFRHDTLSGNFLWGGLTAILSTPCTAPLFPPVLGYALGLPRIEGFILVTTVGCGMASPYLVLSAFPELARRFPRTGAVSELVKQMMGFLMLGAAAFFAGLELVGEPNQWWVVFAVAVWASLYLVVRTPQIAKSAGASYLSTFLAVAICGSSLVLALRLTGSLPTATAATEGVKWADYSPDALAAARASGKPVIVDFTANWCLNCKYVETTVYRDPRTLDAVKNMGIVTLKADLTDHSAPGWKLLDDLKSDGIPFTAIYLPGAQQPVGLASIYTTETLLGVLGGNQSSASPK